MEFLQRRKERRGGDGDEGTRVRGGGRGGAEERLAHLMKCFALTRVFVSTPLHDTELCSDDSFLEFTT